MSDEPSSYKIPGMPERTGNDGPVEIKTSFVVVNTPGPDVAPEEIEAMEEFVKARMMHGLERFAADMLRDYFAHGDFIDVTPKESKEER